MILPWMALLLLVQSKKQWDSVKEKGLKMLDLFVTGHLVNEILFSWFYELDAQTWSFMYQQVLNKTNTLSHKNSAYFMTS